MELRKIFEAYAATEQDYPYSLVMMPGAANRPVDLNSRLRTYLELTTELGWRAFLRGNAGLAAKSSLPVRQVPSDGSGQWSLMDN